MKPIDISGVMRVKKRGDRGYEEVKFDKITERINVLVRDGGYQSTVNSTLIAQSTIKNLYDGISTEELDYIAASVAESRKLVHPDYSGLAGRIMISNLHKTTPPTFSQCMEVLAEKRGKISKTHLWFIIANRSAIDSMINHSADYKFNYIAYRALERQYLHGIKVPETDSNGQPILVDFDGKESKDTTVARRPKYRQQLCDRPQYMFMRVAIEIALCSVITKSAGSYERFEIMVREYSKLLEMIRTYYNELSEMRFIYATPTNFNACTEFPQLNSCFLINTADSIEEIMRTVTNAALISKRAGGIGIAYHKIRCRGAEIKGTSGESSGVVQQLKIFNEDARCWNQGGKRPGSFAVYLEVWHGDILGFLRLKLTQGADSERARDLFYALWICDLFMIRSRNDEPWSLFSEDSAPGLSEVFDGMCVCTKCGHCDNVNYCDLRSRGVLQRTDVGLSGEGMLTDNGRCHHSFASCDVFTNLYTRYEREGKAVRRISPSVIIDAICEAQRDQGVPYICFKDHANRQTNQRNIGTLQSSNLCVAPETYVLTDKGQIKIIDLVDTECNVWNGEEFSQVKVVKTGENQKLIRVNLSNGVSIDCTEYHKFHLYGADVKTVQNERTVVIKSAKDLEPGNLLITYNLPVNSDSQGNLLQSKKMIKEPTNRIKNPYLQGQSAKTVNDIPFSAHTDDKIEWVRGFFEKGKHRNDKEFLLQVRLMLQTIGIHSTVLPQCFDCGDLIESDADLQYLYQIYIGESKIFADDVHTVLESCAKTVRVVSVEDVGRVSDTYCFTEPLRGLGMFNGVLTGQCTEIYEWHSKDEYACCSLASINLKSYVKSTPVGETNISTILARFDFAKMHENVKLVARGLDRIITGNKYPVPECAVNANRLRPIGIGVQGLANVFMELRIPFLSKEAERLDLEIFETLYHAALEASCELAEELGAYDGFEGSPLHQGTLRMDLWLQNQLRMQDITNNGLLETMSQYGFTYFPLENTDNSRKESKESKENTEITENTNGKESKYTSPHVLSGRYDWAAMRARVQRGVRNSLLVAPMPTVTTSILLGNYESFEPMPMNIYTKSIMSGKFTEANDYMIKHLCELNIWNDTLKNRIIANNGSLTGLDPIPAEVQAIYAPVWEMKQTAIMRRAALRHMFVDQGQSLNIHLADNSNAYLRGVLNVGWELGNNTGSYYIRTPPAVEPLKNNIAEVKTQNEVAKPAAVNKWNVIASSGDVCTPGCDSCSS